MVSFGTDVAAVLHDCSLDDRETETGATIASREVRLKQSAKICRFDSLPCIDDFSTQQTLFSVVPGDNRNLLLAIYGSECIERIVDQIYKHTFDLFHIEH